MVMTNYTLMAYAPEAAQPFQQTIAAARDSDALEAVRRFLRGPQGVRQVELWRDDRRIATVERVV
ncbi:MAG: hypothetical protein JWQ46_199 [Phenylobacterium sp.]|nr:hypothetical protein [Phenylobacterium sp.]